MTVLHVWQQLAYSLIGLVVGFILGRYWPRKPKVPDEERRVASRRASDQGRDIPRTLTIIIMVMLLLTVGGVIKSQYDDAHLRDQRHTDVERQLARNARQAKVAQELALRVKSDENLLSHLVLSISQAKSPQDVSRAIHKFIRKSRRLDARPLPGVPPSEQPNPPQVRSSQQSTSSTSSSRPSPRPSNTHPPPRKRRHRPSSSPKPVMPLPAPVPSQLCILVLGPTVCGRLTPDEVTSLSVGPRQAAGHQGVSR